MNEENFDYSDNDECMQNSSNDYDDYDSSDGNECPACGARGEYMCCNYWIEKNT